MKQTEPKNISPISDEAIENRLNKMIAYRKEVIKAVEEFGYEYVLLNGIQLSNGEHINPPHLMNGNDKTGKQCYTVSFIPIFDCVNCGKCGPYCYDIRNDCIYTDTLKSRAINSALRELNPERFWERVGEMVAEIFAKELRINVGGDLKDGDFELVDKYVDKVNPKCDILFFTKNYDGINNWLDSINGKYSSNLHPVMSGWKGMECSNPYHLPMSHVLFIDGTSDEYLPKFGAYYCGGNCTECNFKDEGCWVLKEDEHVIFLAH